MLKDDKLSAEYVVSFRFFRAELGDPRSIAYEVQHLVRFGLPIWLRLSLPDGCQFPRRNHYPMVGSHETSEVYSAPRSGATPTLCLDVGLLTIFKWRGLVSRRFLGALNFAVRRC